MVGNLVTVIVAVANYHRGIVSRAIESVHKQTLPVDLIVIDDLHNTGAGKVRNEGAANVETLFTVFLDADDWLEPDGIERLVSCYREGHYTYGDDYQDDSYHATPDCGVWQHGEWHTVTALIPTRAFRAINGFDESLPALEDKDFFLRLHAIGICGIRCPHGILHYSADGQRSKNYKLSDPNETLLKNIYKQHGVRAKIMCLMGCGGIQSQTPPDELGKQEGDILAVALYSPRKEFGNVTGRLYPKPLGVNNYQLWVNPLDVAKSPEKWQAVVKQAAYNLTPTIAEIQAMAREALEPA